MPRNAILKNCTVAIVGDLGPGRETKQIRKWVEVNGGAFGSSITEDTTHLLCTPEHFKSHKAAITKQTSRHKSVKVVTFDWLEDSLHKKTKKREGPYLIEKKAETKARKREARERNLLLSNSGIGRVTKPKTVKKFEQGCQKLNDKCFAGGYHIFRDETGFAYNVYLSRRDMVEREGKGIRCYLRVGHPTITPLYTYTSPRYTRVPIAKPRAQCLQLYESATEPKTYFSYMTKSSPSGSFTEVVAPKPSSQVVALGLFKDYFKVKTGVEWEKRDVDVDAQEKPTAWAPWKYAGPGESPTQSQEDLVQADSTVTVQSHDDIEW